MKNLKQWLMACMVLLAAGGLGALETGFSTEFGNFGLAEYAADDTEYKPFFQWGGDAWFKDTAGVDENLMYGVELDVDSFLKYRLKANLEFHHPYFSISLGPVFGILNEKLTLVKPGINGSITGKWPGRLYATLGGEIIPPLSYSGTDDYISQSGFYTLGVYILRDHILCYFTQEIEHYSVFVSGAPVQNIRNSYLFFADFYEKNSRFKVQTKLGYEVQNRILTSDDDFGLKNILFGLRFDFFIDGASTVFAGLDSRFYPISSGSIDLTGLPGYLWTLSSGYSWSPR